MKPRFVTATAIDGPSARAALSGYERAVCGELACESRRRDYRAGRLACKRAIGRACGIRPGPAIVVATTRTGAPRPVVGTAASAPASRVRVSISHRDGRAIAVAAPVGVRVGVDLERANAVDSGMARYFLTAAELETGAGPDITVLWMIKEAVWKALAIGRSVPFKDVELVRDALGAVGAVRALGVVTALRVSLASPWRGYLAATVWCAGVEARGA